MAISETQKVDYLWKKLAYGLSKTDTNANKRATNESIASPLLLSGENVWSQSDLIPATMPGSSSGVVTVYPTSSPDETTADASATTNRTWKTGLTDWISPEFGSTYLVKVYIHTAGQSGSAASSGTQVFGAGSGNDDEWFFDYQSGILHFIGTNLPSGISGKSIYVSGARYTGIKGVAVPGAGATFTTLSVSGLSTFSSNVDINAGLDVDGLSDLDELNVSGVSTFQSHVKLGDNDRLKFGAGEDLQIWHNGSNSYITQYSDVGDLYLNCHNDDNDVIIQTDNGSGSTTDYFRADGSTGESLLYHYGSEKLATKSNGIDVTGHTETDTLNVSGISTFQNKVHLLDNDKLHIGGAEGDAGDLQIYHDGSASFISDVGTGPLRILSNQLRIRNNDNTAELAKFLAGGQVELYHDNSKKLETTTDGVVITGIATATGVDATGIVTATSFEGSGANLTNLPASGDSNDITACLFI